MKHINLEGQRYGRLIVKSQLPRINEHYRYLCLCDCGKIIEVNGENLRSGKVKSCGCLRHESPKNKLKDRREAILKREYSSLKKRNRKFASDEDVISFQEFKELVNQPCFYCNEIGSKEISDRIQTRGKIFICSGEIININGIDRLDSSKGYIKGNCIPCCTRCNYAKHTQTLQEFKDWVCRVYNKLCK